jgi:hypothetical protein
MESFWDDGQAVTTERYFIVDAASGEVTRYAASTQAYTNERLIEMLKNSGFQSLVIYPSLTGKPADLSEMIVLLAQKGA